MPFSPETIETNPYNQCLICENLGVTCDGPNMTAMSMERFCEWCRLRKEQYGWSNAHLAELSGVSKGTVDRLIAGLATGITAESKSRVACSLIYKKPYEGSWGKYPCTLAAHVSNNDAIDPAEVFRLQEQVSLLQHQLHTQSQSDREKIDFLKKQIEFKESQMLTKDKQLEDRAWFIKRKDRMIVALAICLGVSVLVIFAGLLIDVLNPNLGFFWRETLTALIP